MPVSKQRDEGIPKKKQFFPAPSRQEITVIQRRSLRDPSNCQYLAPADSAAGDKAALFCFRLLVDGDGDGGCHVFAIGNMGSISKLQCQRMHARG